VALAAAAQLALAAQAALPERWQRSVEAPAKVAALTLVPADALAAAARQATASMEST
jgi:hypothetical protein